MDIIIVGAGKLGRGLAKSLSNEGHNITVVDYNAKKVEELVDKFDVQGICGSGTHIDVLNEANVNEAKLVISTTHSDEYNILVCLIAKKLGAKHTIARVRNPEYNAQFDFMRNELGISLMVNPDFNAALEIGRILQFPDASNVETFANGIIDMAEYRITEESSMCNEKISNISSRISRKMLICAVERNGEVYIPNGDFVLKSGDKIHITGEHKELSAIGKSLTSSKKRSLKDIMIIGCSRVGIYLADMLVSLGKNVVIVDKNREKCEIVFDMVPDATVLNGDANNHDFLTEEGIENMDAVITLTDIEKQISLFLYMRKASELPKLLLKLTTQILIKCLTILVLTQELMSASFQFQTLFSTSELKKISVHHI